MHQSFDRIFQELKQGNATCFNRVQSFLKNIYSKKHLHAFVEVFEEEALSRAKEIDAKIKNGTAGKLAGMVIGIKDNICYKDHRSEACSNMLKGFQSLYTATALQRLLEEDIIVIGRLNCDEFAMGGSNEYSAYGAASNPYNTDFVTGGSSGGSAAAVAAGLCDVALGSDTGGSVRQPASFCGVYGFKPSYGRISRKGLIAFGSSFDQIGVLSNSGEDAAMVLEIMSAHDEGDATTTKDVLSFVSTPSEKKFRIAVIRQSLEAEGLDPEIRKHFTGFIDALKSNGHTINIVDFPLLKQMVPAYYILTTAEASSNLSRYSGLIYGHRSDQKGSLEELISTSRSEGFGLEVKRRILLGTFVLSSGFYDAYYQKAQRIRRKILDATCKIYEDSDLLLSPVTPSTAFKKGSKQDPVSMYLEDIFTVHANLTGIPAMAFPAGKHSNTMPFGYQISADRFKEATILDFVRKSKELLVS